MSTSEIDKLREHFGIDYGASEVKRWETISIDTKIPGTRSDVDGVPRVTVVLASDFDRIMSERDELWKRATKFVMPGEMDTGESIEHYIKTLEQTVARQAKQLELAKILYHAAIKLVDRYSKEKFPLNQTVTIEDVMSWYDKELEAIEQGEGM